MQVVLVAVDADGEFSGVARRLVDADAGAPGGRVDHVGAAVELAARELAAAGGVVPRRGGGAGHVLEYPDRRVHVTRALDIAEREFADQGDVHAADEAHLAGARGERGGDPDEERSFVLLEDDRLHVRQIDRHVDEGEAGFGELLRHRCDRRGLCEAHGHDHRRASPRHVADCLFAHRRVGHLEFAIVESRFRRGSARRRSMRLR